MLRISMKEDRPSLWSSHLRKGVSGAGLSQTEDMFSFFSGCFSTYSRDRRGQIDSGMH
jgi:hypothetical protein